MKQALIIFIIISGSMLAEGQTVGRNIDSLSLENIKHLPRSKQDHFDKILKNRLNYDWLIQLDTAKFDYAFIQETYCQLDSSITVTERYFIKTDSIPKSVFLNGKFMDPKGIYDGFLIWYTQNVTYYTTLYPLIKSYNSLKSIQELPYNKKQIWSHGCVVFENDKKKFTERRTKQLKTTYQIQTMVDRVNNKIVVSVQYAPKRPKFETYSYNAVWDW